MKSNKIFSNNFYLFCYFKINTVKNREKEKQRVTRTKTESIPYCNKGLIAPWGKII